MSKQNKQYEIESYYVTKTERAICITDDLDSGDEIWLPLFDIWGNKIVTYEIVGAKVTIWAPENLLAKKGLV